MNGKAFKPGSAIGASRRGIDLGARRREPVAPFVKSIGLAATKDLHTCRNCDHVAAFTSRSQAGSTSGAAGTTASLNSIVIAVAPRADAAAIVHRGDSVTAGTNSGASSAGTT
jgi:hypothetical protein